MAQYWTNDIFSRVNGQNGFDLVIVLSIVEKPPLKEVEKASVFI